MKTISIIISTLLVSGVVHASEYKVAKVLFGSVERTCTSANFANTMQELADLQDAGTFERLEIGEIYPLDGDDIKSLADLIFRAPNLKSLKLEYIESHSNHMPLLVESLSRLSNLQSLHIAYRNHESSVVPALAVSCLPHMLNLEYLNMCYAGLTPKDVDDLRLALTNLPRLRRLDFSHNIELEGLGFLNATNMGLSIRGLEWFGLQDVGTNSILVQQTRDVLFYFYDKPWLTEEATAGWYDRSMFKEKI